MMWNNEESVPYYVAFMEQKASEIAFLANEIGGSPCIVALDGRCAAGKTTLAEFLKTAYGFPVIHADDFFLRVEQRTEERYREPGGNLDRERLKAEVLLPLKEGKAVTFRRFDCTRMELGEELSIPESNVVVVEGSYSTHPELRDLYDLKVFLDINEEDQKERIRQRNGEAKLQVFIDRWIPLEELYFSNCGVKESADLYINTSMADGI
ncbi:MAG: dephospho-CoA kinase [Solobacterium sp.]|nr:dephospho-CoA kinase [Solobacterium sp.]